MVGCTSAGRNNGNGGGSRNPAFAATSTPVSESLEMMKKQPWSEEFNEVVKDEIREESADETKVRIFEDVEVNGTTVLPQRDSMKKASESTSEEIVPNNDSGPCFCGLTHFQVTFILGMMGFILFWMGLLLRIYLPDEFFS